MHPKFHARQHSGAGLALLMLIALGCATASVQTLSAPPRDGTLAKPPVLLIYDFATSAYDVAVDSLGPSVISSGSQTSKQAKTAHKIAQLLSEKLAEKLNARGIRAKRATDGDIPPIDAFILSRLERADLDPSPEADKTALIRRVSFDLTGLPPELGEIDAFVSDESPRAYEKVVDRLLASPDFVTYWTFRFASLLRIRSLPNDERVARAYQDWVRARIEAGTPYDAMVRALITTLGDSHENGAAAFYRMTSDARAHAEFMSETFLGARLRCASATI